MEWLQALSLVGLRIHAHACTFLVADLLTYSRVRVVVDVVVKHLPSVAVTPVWPPPDGNADSRVRVVVTSVRLYPDISSDGYPYIFDFVVFCIYAVNSSIVCVCVQIRL